MIELPRNFLGMTRQECLFVEALLNAKTTHVSHEEITEAISNAAADATRISQVIACKTRKKLDAYFDAKLIETTWGRGYRLSDGARDLILQAAGFEVREAA